MNKPLHKQFLGYKMEAGDGSYGAGTDITTYAVYRVTYEDKNGKTFTRDELELA